MANKWSSFVQKMFYNCVTINHDYVWDGERERERGREREMEGERGGYGEGVAWLSVGIVTL